MSYVNEVLADSPLAYWRLGEASGPDAFDSSGNGFDAIYDGNPTLGEPGLIVLDADSSCRFNGSTQDVDCTNTALLQISTGTIEAWIKTSDSATFRAIMVKQFAYNMFVTSGVLMTFDYPVGQQRSSGVTINDNQPHHVALTFGGGTGQLYVDGAAAGASFTFNVLNHTQKLFLAFGNAGGQFMTGTLDECAVYSAKLSAARIAAHYEEGTAVIRRLELAASVTDIHKNASHHETIQKAAAL
jgi:hypothetical protein